ncbi:MAG: enoyl-CoA hydratase/isomerase family protein [Gammaproteobacteria bacterium]|nr:enoyl-CoA hydratase/isomerase family protein [Gammaproteobacteria bacterium]
MNYQKLKFSIDEGIARIVIVDPANHNAVDLAVTQELRAAATECEVASDLRCVLLTASGAEFSVGGNLREFLSERDHIQAHTRAMTIDFHAAILILNRLPVPVVCAVNGLAAGGGASLVCMSDLAIATRSAKFNFAYTRSGLTPDGGATYFLPRLVGAQRAFDILATNPTLTATEAQAMGLIARVVDDEAYPAAVEALLKQLAAMPSNSVGHLKRLLRQGMDNTLAEQLDCEGRGIAGMAASPTTMATMEAFFARAKR